MWLEGEAWQEVSPKQKRKLVEQDSFYRSPESCHHSSTSILSSCSFCYFGVSTVGRMPTSGSCENQGAIRYNLGATLSLHIPPKELPCSSVPLPGHTVTNQDGMGSFLPPFLDDKGSRQEGLPFVDTCRLALTGNKVMPLALPVVDTLRSFDCVRSLACSALAGEVGHLELLAVLVKQPAPKIWPLLPTLLFPGALLARGRSGPKWRK